MSAAPTSADEPIEDPASDDFDFLEDEDGNPVEEDDGSLIELDTQHTAGSAA